jgi:uncharacterized membrane protein YdjX (TVP38/TMEM64 family)
MTEREDPWRRPAHPALGCCADASGARAGSRRGSIAALLALLAVGIGTTAAVAFGVDAGFALATLKSHHAWLLGFVAGAPVMASLLFMAVYALAVAVSVPGLAVLTVIGGYLFGWLEGSAYVLVATTPAATGLFLVAQSALGAPLQARAGPALLRFAEGFRDHAASYVFVLHLVPIFPYAMVIGIPAACGVRMRTFVVSAFLGLLPGTLLFAHLGDGLGEVLSAGLPIGLSSLLRAEIMVSIIGLALLALLPVLWGRLRR